MLRPRAKFAIAMFIVLQGVLFFTIMFRQPRHVQRDMSIDTPQSTIAATIRSEVKVQQQQQQQQETNNDDGHRSSSSSSENDNNNNSNSKKYVIAVHESGLNNYIRALADAAYILARMNNTDLTLLVHPNIQNAHSTSRAFSVDNQGNVQFREKIDHSVVPFSDLFHIPNQSFHTTVHFNNGTATTVVTRNFARLNIEMATPSLLSQLSSKQRASSSSSSSAAAASAASADVVTPPFRVGHCRMRTDIGPEQKLNHFITCINNHFQQGDNNNNNNNNHQTQRVVVLHRLALKSLGVENVPDIQPSLYEMMYSTFRSLPNDSISDMRESSIMVHLRLGDFCAASTDDCYFDMRRVEPHILRLQSTTGAKHVIIMTNPIPEHQRQTDPTIAIIDKHPHWYLCSDLIEQSKSVPERMKRDVNAVLALEMAAAVSAQYFVGNVRSTVARSIALLRKRQNKTVDRSISFPTLAGKAHDECVHCADLFV